MSSRSPPDDRSVRGTARIHVVRTLQKPAREQGRNTPACAECTMPSAICPIKRAKRGKKCAISTYFCAKSSIQRDFSATNSPLYGKGKAAGNRGLFCRFGLCHFAVRAGWRPRNTGTPFVPKPKPSVVITKNLGGG